MSEIAERAREALRQVHDPEAGLNIVDLGLIYAIEEAEGSVRVAMTFTTEACPAGPLLAEAARAAVLAVDGVREAAIDITFDPPWTPERITPEGRDWLSVAGEW